MSRGSAYGARAGGGTRAPAAARVTRPSGEKCTSAPGRHRPVEVFFSKFQIQRSTPTLYSRTPMHTNNS
eukprot:scaffold34420_cov70-Phaeocystis_antarctica.AAC.2